MNIREWIQYGLDEGGCPNLTVTCEWNNRFTRRLGDACWFKSKNYGRIRLSSKLWPSMSDDEKIDTVLHEVAHIIDKYKNGNASIAYKGRKYGGGHGPTWHAIAKQIGAKPQRYADKNAADFQRFRRRVTRHIVKCNCVDNCIVSQTVLNKMKKGYTYCCSKCKSRLQLSTVQLST